MRLTLTSVLLLLAASASAGEEPRYDGIAASEWAVRLADRDDWYEARERLVEGGPASLPVVVTLLGHESAKVRARAAYVAGAHASDAAEAVPALVEILRGQEEEATRSASRALGKIGPAAAPAVPALLALLDAPTGFTRSTAARALLKLGPVGESALLTALREDPSESRIQAVALGRETMVPGLVALLDTEDEALRDAAVTALVRIGWVSVPSLERAEKPEVADRVLTGGLGRYLEYEMKESDGRLEIVTRRVPSVPPGELSIDWESGSGHGHTLRLHRFRWTKAGLRVDRISYHCPRTSTPRESPIAVEFATIDSETASAMLRALVRARGLSLREKPREEGQLGSAGWGSTADFHSRILLTTAGGPLVDESYTGYPGDDAFRGYFRLRAVDGVLREAGSQDKTSSTRPKSVEMPSGDDESRTFR